MKTIIITEDITKITTLGGKFGKIYSWLLINLQKLKIKIILGTITDKKNTVLVTSDNLLTKSDIKVIHWDKALSENQLERERSLAWKITNETLTSLFNNLRFKNILFIDVWRTHLTIHLAYTVLNYRQAIERLIKTHHPSRIIVLGSSPQEEIAKFIASKNKIDVECFKFPDFSKINGLVLDWLYGRQLSKNFNKFTSSHSKDVSIPKGSYLLAVSFFRHLKTLIPLQQILKKINLSSVFVVDDDLHGNPSLNTTHLASQLSKRTISKIYSEQRKVGMVAWQKIKHKIDCQPNNINELTVLLLQKYLKTLSLRAYPLVCLYLQAADRLISKFKPQGVFIISDLRPLEVSLALIARQHNIPSLLVSPNTILSRDAINEYTLADRVTVVGPYLKSQLVEIGVSDNKIQILGDLRFYQIDKAKKEASRLKVYQKLNLPAEAKLVLLTSFRPNPEIPLKEKRRFFEISSQAVSQIPQARLIIKPHPTENKYQLLTRLKQWGITNALVTDNNELELIEILSACRAVLITWSMTGFEAIIMKKPVIVVNPTNKNYDRFIPYVSGGGAVKAASETELINYLDTLLDKNHPLTKERLKDASNFCQHYIKLPDKNISQRLEQILIQSSARKT